MVILLLTKDAAEFQGSIIFNRPQTVLEKPGL